MYQVHAEMSRPDAERVSDLLQTLEPSPVSAVAIEEVSRTAWSIDGYCLDAAAAEGAASIIEREVPGASASIQKLQDRDWVALSLEGLPPVEAGPFVVAGAHALAQVRGGAIPIWIEAGPAFGTGHHGTTKGCLEALAKLTATDRPQRILDVGTGSGVLAIAALKSGAERVVATDLDGESIRIARENARNNKVGRKLKLIHAAGAAHAAIRAEGPYDLIMANILARPLVHLAPDLAQLVKPGGRVILSGLLTRQEPQVRAAYEGRGLVLMDRRRIKGWTTLVYARPRAAAVATPPARRMQPVLPALLAA
jgi:ribosomal protein L11 methyltransferase